MQGSLRTNAAKLSAAERQHDPDQEQLPLPAHQTSFTITLCRWDWRDEEACWNDWSPASTWDYHDEDYELAGGDPVHPGDDGVELTAEEQENEKRLEEAFVLAGEANRTLAEAKQAVANVRVHQKARRAALVAKERELVVALRIWVRVSSVA